MEQPGGNLDISYLAIQPELEGLSHLFVFPGQV